MTRLARSLLLMVALLLTPMVAFAQPPAGEHYVGRVPGTEAFIAVVLDGDLVLAYVCDGTPEGVSLWGWFSGALGAGSTVLVSTNGHALFLDATGPSPQGHLLTRTGESFPFTTELAGQTAGLLRQQGLEDGQPSLSGWIGLNNGEQRGAKMVAGTSGGAGYIEQENLRR
jgi:hypothetical protein